jgi:secreted protein with Ig-like and vWFA domain
MKPENLTAWALNELSVEEQARLEAELSADPAVQASAETTKDFCSFLTRELRDESMALTPEQRAQFTTVKVQAFLGGSPRFEPKPLRWWQRPAIPMAAAAAMIVLGAITANYLTEEASDMRTVEQLLVQKTEPAKEVKVVGNKKTQLPEIPKSLGSPPPTPLQRGAAASQSTTFSLAETPPVILSSAPASPMLASADVRFPNGGAGNGFGSGSGMKTGAGTITLSGTNTGDAVSRRRAFVNDIVDSFRDKRKQQNTESYSAITENTLISVAREPLSTFSIDVDTASYANVRRFLNMNTKPPRDAVRVEELINYFPSSESAPDADSKQPFAVKVEMAACPWQPQHRLARIHLKGRDVAAGSKPSNLVFLVDVSGSMNSEDKLALVQRSLRMLAERLGESDRVSLVTYAGGTEIVLPSTNGMKKADIIDSIDRLKAGGSTAGAAGIKLAYEQAVSGFIKGGVNRVILCTDGDFNVGISDPKELEGFITEKARSGVFLSVLGFGTGNLKDRMMETLADKGNGNYAYIDSVSEARKVLVEQMQGTLVTIAKDVKIQVEFNPALIREFRLIGYENRLLAKEDFNDDTKDAGEIGAGHSITALYELVPANLPPGATPPPIVDKLKYQPEAQQLASPPPVQTLATATNEAITVKLRYKEPEGTTSKLLEVPLNDDARTIEQASPEFKFTAAVACFGMLMRESSYAGQLTWDAVRQLAREGKGSDALGYRGEFLQLIEKAAGK